MIRILVDLTRMIAGGENGGIKPALLALFGTTGRVRENVTFVYLVSKNLAAEISSLAAPHDKIVVSETATRDVASREHCTAVFCAFGNTDWACPGIPTITLIVDLAHRDFPQTLSLSERQYREHYFRQAMLRTDIFVVISDFTGDRLRLHYPEATNRIVRVYLTARNRFIRATQPGKYENPFFFYPANGWVHKNHETLLIAYGIYKSRTPKQSIWRLKLSGHLDERFKVIKNLAITLNVAAEVDIVGYVSEEQLAELWAGAGALVFPSLHEGFGIPLLEAMTLGVPLVASSSTAIPEIVRDAGLLVEARSPTALADAMCAIATDDSLRRNLIVRGRERVRDFVFEKELAFFFDLIRATTRGPSRFKSDGFYPADGLTDPVAVFGLPGDEQVRLLTYATKPLGCTRNIEFWCGSECIRRVCVPAEHPSTERLVLPTGAPTLTIVTVDASKLSSTDPRTHGVLLNQLDVTTSDGCVHDLLVPA